LLDCPNEFDSPGRALVLVSSTTAGAAETIVAACNAGGYSAVWCPPPAHAVIAGVRLILCDTNSVNETAMSRWARLVGQYPGIPLIALVSFPREQDVPRVSQTGVSAVVTKPYLLADLFSVMAEALSTPLHTSANLLVAVATNSR
jgi:CheY-like chemotaxis protein